MPIFQQLIDRWFRDHPSQEEEDPDYLKLLKLKDEHIFIDVRVTRTGEQFQSMILDIDGESDTLLLDEFLPNESPPNLREGDPIQVISRTRRYGVEFFSRILAKRDDEQGPSYLIQLPDEIGANPLQQVYRVSVERERDLQILLPPVAGVNLAGRLINLSPEGVKLQLQGDQTALLNQHYLLSEVVIRLPDRIDIECNLQLRTVYRSPTGQEATIASGRLEVPHPPMRVKLEQYLAAVQRKQRRQALQESDDPL